MPKQRDIAALREAVLSRAFTPPAREIEPLAGLLGDPDEAVAHGAELAIVRAGASPGAAAGIVQRLLAGLGGAPPEARVRGFRVVGRLVPTDADSARAVIAGLRDEDERVKRAAAHTLGRLPPSEADAEIAAALLSAWDDVPELPLARALAEAMGKLRLAGSAVHERLQAIDGDARGGDKELARIAKKALAMHQRDGSRGEASEVDGAGRAADFDVPIVLLCRAGVEAMVADELRERCAGAGDVRGGPEGSGQVTTLWSAAQGPLEGLFAVRTMLGFGFSLPPEPFADEADVEGACARALTSMPAARILETWTTGAVRYRLDWHGHGHRRASTWKVVHAVAERRPAWINDPTDSTWQASITVASGAVRVLLSPRKLADPRFLYRVRDVPAASHPTLAAALVRASHPREDDVVWDPFVGSGTELIERARAGPYRQLVGSDLDPDALAAARANVEAAGGTALSIALETGDATRHAPPGVTSILTNPPMGRRVARDGSLADLLDAFTDHAARVLVPRGRVTWLSPLGGRTAARAEAAGLTVALRKSVDMGGFHAELQVWQKR